MTQHTKITRDMIGKADRGYTFFDLMVEAGQMIPVEKEEMDLSGVRTFFSRFKISRPSSLGGALPA